MDIGTIGQHLLVLHGDAMCVPNVAKYHGQQSINIAPSAERLWTKIPMMNPRR